MADNHFLLTYLIVLWLQKLMLKLYLYKLLSHKLPGGTEENLEKRNGLE
jgi:hypothetical protein